MSKSRKFAAFLAIVFLTISHPHFIYAQDYEDDQDYPHIFLAGLVGGLNISQVDGDNFAGYYKAGANFGGIGYARLKRHMMVSFEILYSQKGSSNGSIMRYSNVDSLLMTKYRINVNYAEIPLMINFFDKHMSHLSFGFSYSQLVSSSETLMVTNTLGNIPPYPVDLSKYPFKKSNIDFLAGAQLHMYKGLFLNLRFQYSVIPIRTNVPADFARSQQYSNLWAIRLMYLFGTGTK